MMWDRKDLKKRGKAAFLANYWKCVLVGILLVAFVAGSSASVSSSIVRGGANNANVGGGSGSVTTITDGTGSAYVISDGNNQAVVTDDDIRELMQDPEFQSVVLRLFAVIGATLLVAGLISACLRLLVFNPLEVGCQGFFTRNTEAPASLDQLKAGFHSYGRTVGAMFLRDLFLFLWCLLCIIPGVIKTYSYRMVPYILADDPAIGARDAITLSRRMMNGHKWNAFVLDLSFLGWDILSALTLGLLGIFYVNPYQYSTYAELYQALKNQ